jgi:hypothetical protein
MNDELVEISHETVAVCLAYNSMEFASFVLFQLFTRNTSYVSHHCVFILLC